MKMNFLIVSKLLSSSITLLLAGYFVFSLCMLDVLFQTAHSIFYSIVTISSVILIAIHHYVSIRVKFDASIFDFLSQAKDRQHLDQLTQQLDESLIAFKLMSKHKAGRDWELRFQGCMKLFKVQITLLIAQFIVLIVIAMT